MMRDRSKKIKATTTASKTGASAHDAPFSSLPLSSRRMFLRTTISGAFFATHNDLL
jgi:hypothetical protein